MIEHLLKAVRAVNLHGDPTDPCYAECTCRWRSEAGPLEDVAEQFDEHTDTLGAPRAATPWR